MSIRASNWAWNIHGLTLSERLVLLALANFSDDQGHCWPKQDTMTEMTGLGIRTVERSIASMKTMQVIETEGRYLRGKRTSNYYVLNLTVTQARSKKQPATQPGSKKQPATQPGTTRHTAGHMPATGPGIYIEEPSLEPSVEPSGENGEESEKKIEKEDKGIKKSNIDNHQPSIDRDEEEYPDDVQLIANPLPIKSGPAKKKKPLTLEQLRQICAEVDAEDD